MAFDRVPIGISDGLPKNRRLCRGRARISGCPGLENALGAVEMGIESSPAFVREPDGNGCIERFFRTLKEQLLWVRHFQSIPELVRALEQIRALYNQHWLIERLGFEPPVQARQRLALQPAPCAWWSYLSKKSGAVQLEYGGSYLSKKSGAVHNPQIT